MNTTELLERYGRMRQLSQQMLDAARRRDDASLSALEQARAAIERELARADTGAWPATEGVRKGELIRATLEADTETRTLVAGWMEELRQHLGNASTARKLSQAYGPA
jgi:hypothetical protein